MRIDLPVIIGLLACVLFVAGLAAKPSRTNLIWYVLGAGCVVYVLTGCTHCSNWFQAMNGDTLGYMFR